MNWKLACIQMDIVFGNPERNLEKATELIEKAAISKPNIIVLPELWTTGYDLTRLEEIADSKGVNTIGFLKKMAIKYKVHFVGGSIANRTEKGVKNTLFVITKDGELVHEYSKLHLFRLMDEHLYLIPGSEKGLFELEQQSLAAMICYDIRFPEWIRSHTVKGAKALFVVAEWPMPRLHHWRSLLIARAIENQCYVIACNRAGSDPNNEFAGHSMVIDPWGEIVAEAGELEEIMVADIDFAKVDQVRSQIPIFTDRIPELYN
ncbi:MULTISPECIES: carbon-nitrogen family hydrolase [unclassified Bacillus (in: firmicutes)]|uniref:carbon-nitrogen family hydrolase n=1 Tax=unclassified Bacillus (in: firmicutes) TaxID=185979 RepID=UPI0008E4ECBC|nr:MULTISPECIES: carbon-nitrogen family hydrolase [unclassified Bacillus (in: firmicutes)]SFA77313.1 Carbon-nitrogen hydrolase [Bacillus sp. UNCCL13]SFQ67258.1 Carbon-nitrogen hydrolase [Bacillus sp. cl95]